MEWLHNHTGILICLQFRGILTSMHIKRCLMYKRNLALCQIVAVYLAPKFYNREIFLTRVNSYKRNIFNSTIIAIPEKVIDIVFIYHLFMYYVSVNIGSGGGRGGV